MLLCWETSPEAEIREFDSLCEEAVPSSSTSHSPQ